MVRQEYILMTNFSIKNCLGYSFFNKALGGVGTHGQGAAEPGIYEKVQ